MVRLQLSRWLFFIFAFAASTIVAGCVGGGSSFIPVQPISVSVAPRAASVVATTQLQQFSATVMNDPNNRGVAWDVDGVSGGSASSGIISTNGLYSPPPTPGTHTVGATSLSDGTNSASVSIAVTDLAGVLTYHYDLARDGANSSEYALTTASVSQATFGKLFACQVDGADYTEPLWVPALTVNGSVHSVIFVATQHDSLYAFDADASPCQQLWHVNLIDSVHGGTSGESSVTWSHVGSGYQDIYPEIGVVGTPVIDSITNTLYVVSKSESTGPIFHQRLHAIDVATGNEKLTFNAPVNISATTSGTGYGSSGGVLNFNVQTHNERSALALVSGVVYICW